MFVSTNDPVPYVFFVMPGSTHACPNSAACWSPAMPLTGTREPGGVLGRRHAEPAAATAAPPEGTSAGRRTGRTARRTSRARRCRRASCGYAFDGSVACTPPSGPPVRLPQDPRVDGAEREVGVRRRRRPRVSSHASFVAEKYGSSTSPVRSPDERLAARRRAARRSVAAVRRSCQTIARCSGRPVRRSQTTTVSRWFVMPIAATVSPGVGELRLRPRPSVSSVARQISSGVVLDPARLREVLRELAIRPRRAGCRARRPRTARTPVVPASIARQTLTTRRRRTGAGGPRRARCASSRPTLRSRGRNSRAISRSAESRIRTCRSGR